MNLLIIIAAVFGLVVVMLAVYQGARDASKQEVNQLKDRIDSLEKDKQRLTTQLERNKRETELLRQQLFEREDEIRSLRTVGLGESEESGT